MVKITISDDNAFFRRALRRALDTDPSGDLRMLGDGDVDQAAELAGSHRPDVLMLEYGAEAGADLERLRSLVQRHPGVAILLLAHRRDDELLFEALVAGAAGFVMRTATAADIANAARALARGECPLDPQLTNRLVERYRNLARPTACADARATLPPEDLLLLRFVTAGLSNKEIAQRMGLASSTIRNRLTVIFSRIGVSHRTQAALVGIRWGLAPRVVPPAVEPNGMTYHRATS